MGQIREFWNRGWVGKVVILGGSAAALVVVCCVALVALAVIVPSPRQQPVAAVATVQAVTAAPEPTSAPTAVPTNTPAPTSTPLPTVMPVSTIVIQPTMTPLPAEPPPEVQQYAQTVGKEVGGIGTALGALSKLLQAPELTSNDWKIDVVVQIVAIRTAHENISKVTDVPSDMRDIHAQTLSATQDCNDATFALASGLDNSSISDMNQAAELVNSCATKLKEAERMTREYMDR